MIYVAWGSRKHGAHLLTEQMSDEKVAIWRKHGMLSPTDFELFSIVASSWDIAMQKYYDIQGWGKYKLLDVDNKGRAI